VASSGSAAPAGYATYRAAGRPDRRRITRRRFVAGAVGGLALAVLGGDLLSRLGAVTDDAVQGSGGAPQAGGGQTQANGGATNGATNGAGAASGASGDGGGSGTAPQGGATGAVLVSVTASSCVGCGRCLSVCPVGVFAWDASGSHAVASNAGRCIRCHRCLQTCPAGAITVNG
jgi:NAD-dependent dihydropyrimidine dehydrogenase PreA subunit